MDPAQHIRKTDMVCGMGCMNGEDHPFREYDRSTIYCKKATISRAYCAESIVTCLYPNLEMCKNVVVNTKIVRNINPPNDKTAQSHKNLRQGN